MLLEGNERRVPERRMKEEGRLPPGQSATLKWPVLHYGSVPRFDAARWDFRVSGLVEQPLRFTWPEFSLLPKTELVRDFHCGTRWSRFDNRWSGISFREVLQRVRLKPQAAFVLVHAEQASPPTCRWPILIATTCSLPPIMTKNRYPPTTAIACGWLCRTSMRGNQ